MNKKIYITHVNLFIALTLLTLVFWATGPPSFAQFAKQDPASTRSVKKSTFLFEEIVLTHTASLDQCRNGPLTAPEGCAGNNWVNGDLNGSQAHYIEGQSVPYRILFGNLAFPGSHTVTIEWDSSENSLHAIDYLTTFNRTETTANPCFGVTTCDPAVFHDYAIPLDPNVALEGVIQVPGVFRLYGGTITAVSAYVLDGTLDGTSQTSVTITFTADRADPVLTWGGHIATRADWGQGHSAVTIDGAPYHMRILDVDGEGGGNQDRSMQSSAVIYPSDVTIIKRVQTFDGGGSFTTYFPFTAVPFVPSEFSLRDVNDPSQDRLVNTNIMHFGASNAIVVTEGRVNDWNLSDITCVEASAGGTSVQNSTVNVTDRTATLIVEEGETITCTFDNIQQVPTAADAVITGRVMNEEGYGIMGATLTATNLSNGTTKSVVSNMFGNYTIDGLTVPDAYVLKVTHRKYLFKNGSVTFALTDNLEGIDFTAASQ